MHQMGFRSLIKTMHRIANWMIKSFDKTWKHFMHIIDTKVFLTNFCAYFGKLLQVVSTNDFICIERVKISRRF